MKAFNPEVVEHKFVPIMDLKFAQADDSSMEFEGYGAVFNNKDLGGDVIAPGAFTQTIQDAKRTGIWPSMMAQHGALQLTVDDLTPIGIYTDWAEDGKGLYVKGNFAPTERGKEYYALAKMKPRPALNGMSIGYKVKDAVHGTKPSEPKRLLKQLDVHEISLVTFPMNPKARVTGVKSLAELTERDFERWLTQDAGLSRSDARVVINTGFKSLKAMQDAGSQELSGLAAALKMRGEALR